MSPKMARRVRVEARASYGQQLAAAEALAQLNPEQSDELLADMLYESWSVADCHDE